MPPRSLFVLFVGIITPFSLWATPYRGEPLDERSRTVCGADETSLVSSSSDLMKYMARPIGIMRSSAGTCTATLIDKDLVLTARHCKANCASTTVSFGFLGSVSPGTKYKCIENIENGGSSQNEDYYIFRLEGFPGMEWGWYPPTGIEVEPGEPLLMVHHPEGKPLTVSRKECLLKREDNGYFYHRCDSNPGSSGSSILRPDYVRPEETRVVAVHWGGGCNSSNSSTNSAASMKYILTKSATLRALTKD